MPARGGALSGRGRSASGRRSPPARASKATAPRRNEAQKKRQKEAPRARLLVLGPRLLGADRAETLKLARRVFRAARTGDLDVGITFVHDLEMQALNRAWRRKDAPTDVLSFSAQEGERMPGDDHVLGDLVISVDTARRQARRLGHPLPVEVAVLVAHGICHLAGLDHEGGQEAARVQASCERTLLASAAVDVRAALIDRAS
jgi:probable rRNA maturation factor